MTDPDRHAQITVTELDNGSVQYDIIPYNQLEETVIVLRDEDGVLSVRDDDGEYQVFAGTEGGAVVPYDESHYPTFFLEFEGQQEFHDPDTGVSIGLSVNEDGSLIAIIRGDTDQFAQFIGVVPEDNVGFEINATHLDGEVGVVGATTTPEGKNPADITPQFKI